MVETDPKTMQDLTSVVQTLLQQMQDKFQPRLTRSLEEMMKRVVALIPLEKNIADLMTQTGVKNWKVKTRYLLHRRVEGC